MDGMDGIFIFVEGRNIFSNGPAKNVAKTIVLNYFFFYIFLLFVIFVYIRI